MRANNRFVAVDVVVQLGSGLGKAVGIETALEDGVQYVKLVLP